MLEHQLKVLNGVSFDDMLFQKELIKSILWLKESDKTAFIQEVKKRFYTEHSKIIDKVFLEWMNGQSEIH